MKIFHIQSVILVKFLACFLRCHIVVLLFSEIGSQIENKIYTRLIDLFFFFSGLHFKGKNCDPSQKLNLIETVLRGSKQHLFPRSASVGVYGRSAPRMPKPNGGWGDVRDQRLCMSFAPRQ